MPSARLADSTSFSEWLTHQHRDTLASIVGHSTLSSYLAIADGESIGRVKFEMCEVSYHPVRVRSPFKNADWEHKAHVATMWTAAAKRRVEYLSFAMRR
jgi:hypothetical protein